MKKQTFANRLSLRIMAVLVVMTTVIMAIVYLITKDSMAKEAESRYESIILHANEKIRGVLSDVYVGTINNINDIERDVDNPDKLQAHLERMVSQNMYIELPADIRARYLPPKRPQLRDLCLARRFRGDSWQADERESSRLPDTRLVQRGFRETGRGLDAAVFRQGCLTAVDNDLYDSYP